MDSNVYPSNSTNKDEIFGGYVRNPCAQQNQRHFLPYTMPISNNMSQPLMYNAQNQPIYNLMYTQSMYRNQNAFPNFPQESWPQPQDCLKTNEKFENRSDCCLETKNFYNYNKNNLLDPNWYYGNYENQKYTELPSCSQIGSNLNSCCNIAEKAVKSVKYCSIQKLPEVESKLIHCSKPYDNLKEFPSCAQLTQPFVSAYPDLNQYFPSQEDFIEVSKPLEKPDDTGNESDIIVENSEESSSESEFLEKEECLCLICNALTETLYNITLETTITNYSRTKVSEKLFQILGWIPIEKGSKYICNICMTLVNNLDSLENQINVLKSTILEKYHRKNQFPSSFEIKYTKKSRTCSWFKCPICKKKYSLKKFYQFHIARHKKRFFCCRLCKIKFRTLAQFRNHRRKHKTVIGNKYQICGDEKLCSNDLNLKKTFEKSHDSFTVTEKSHESSMKAHQKFYENDMFDAEKYHKNSIMADQMSDTKQFLDQKINLYPNESKTKLDGDQKLHENSIGEMQNHHSNLSIKEHKHHRNFINESQKHHNKQVHEDQKHHENTIHKELTYFENAIYEEQKHHENSIGEMQNHHRIPIIEEQNHHGNPINEEQNHHKNFINEIRNPFNEEKTLHKNPINKEQKHHGKPINNYNIYYRIPINEDQQHNKNPIGSLENGDFKAQEKNLTENQKNPSNRTQETHQTKSSNIHQTKLNIAQKSTESKNQNQVKSSDFICFSCGKTFKTRPNLLAHENLCTGNLPFTCTLCGKSFPSKIRFTIHLKIHDRDFKWVCQKCSKGFMKNSDYEKHLLSHSNKKTYQCLDCGNLYKTLSNLNHHRKSHSKKLPYNCDICHKGFLRKDLLNAHVNVHTGIRPYKCVHCSKSFSMQKYLSSHMRVHENFSFKQCNICGKEIKGSLDEHMLTHSKVKNFECVMCLMKFFTKGALAKHFKRKHEVQEVDIIF